MKKIKISLFALFLLYLGMLGYSFFKFSSFLKTFDQSMTASIKNQVQSLIDARALATFDMAQDLALNPKLIQVMKTKDYKVLYSPNFFPVAKKYTDFARLGLHVMDKNGINRYFSWTHKKVGKDARGWRKDMRVFFAAPQPMHAISVGAFDMTFKGTVPLYDEQHAFLGAVEVISHFDAITKRLRKSGIHGAVVIDKRFNKQLKYPFSPHFIDGYRISTRDLEPDIETILRHYGVANLIAIKDFKHLDVAGKTGHHLHCVSVPILGVNGKPIGWYLAFGEDRLQVGNLFMQAWAIRIGAFVLFMLMAGMIIVLYQKNDELLTSLNQKIEEKTQKNLALIYTDSLTGCYKKSRLDKDLSQYEGSYIVMVDLRNFSKINEAYSFDVGDQVLKKLVQRMREVLRSDIYRIHADGFVFFPRSLKQDIFTLRESLLHDPIQIESLALTLRLQLAFAVDIVRPNHTVLRELSIAMKSAKKQPYRTFVAYKEQKPDQSFLMINAALHEALYDKNGAEIIPYFQAIIDNHTGTVSHYETLTRLKISDKIIMPEHFMPVVQSSGYLHLLTRKMIRVALEQFSTFAGTMIGLSLNITEEDIYLQSFDNYLIEECTYWGIAPEQITLEVLESVTSLGAKRHIKHLNRLHEMGFKIAIDDFGVEYSNFERISTIQIDQLKIDGKYIQNLVDNPRDYAIVKAITEFAHSLGIKVVAEFVENEAIQVKVKELKIDYSQGYYFSKPQPTFTSL